MLFFFWYTFFNKFDIIFKIQESLSIKYLAKSFNLVLASGQSNSKFSTSFHASSIISRDLLWAYSRLPVYLII